VSRFDDDARPRGDDRSFRDFRRSADKEAMARQASLEAVGAVAKRLRMRRFTWCRAENAVYDDKIWRLVARMAGAPLYLVEALVLRLDLHASAARSRGTLDGFSIPALAAHWGIASEDVLARIYAALEHPDIGWIDGDHVATFWDRNPDTEDTTAADRTHRSKAFKKAMKAIAALRREGRIDAAGERAMIRDLYALREEARAGHFARGELVRRLALLLQPGPTLSTERGAHVVTTVTTVSLTPRSDQNIRNEPAVDNHHAAAGGDAAGLSREEEEQPGKAQGGLTEQQQAALWLETEGLRIVTEQLQENRQLAATKIARWRDQDLSGDAAALADIIRGADKTGVFGLRFLNLIVDGLRTARLKTTAQRELPMPPVPVAERKMG
jgi:hypothetical protein